MKSFNHFYLDLNESLNTPQQYFLTDDTDGKDTYARFEIDGKEYMMSLVESKVPGVFEILMGRLAKNKPRYWSFYSPNHIRQAFSTLLHFLESTITFRGPLIQGTYLRVRGKREVAKRMESFVKRMLNRTFIKTFQYVEVEQPSEKEIVETSFWFSVMIIKKGLSPSAVFNKAHFKKYNFEYSNKEDKIPAEAIETLKPKKTPKKSLTKEPSKKYSYNGLELDLTIDDAVFDDIIQNVKRIPSKNGKILKSNIDPLSLKSNIPGSGIAKKEDGKWKEEPENIVEKVDYISETLGYGEMPSKIKEWHHVKRYTSSFYTNYNEPLREISADFFEDEKITKQELGIITNKDKMIPKLASAFDDVDPLPEPIWVYRGGYIGGDTSKSLIPGSDYVDPAFLSTSIRSYISFGSNLRLRIYLPKGSKVLPVLKNSKYPTENEVILPAMSVIKIIEVEKALSDTGYEQFFVTGIFVGSAFKSFQSQIKSLPISENYLNMTLEERITKELLEMKKTKPTESETDKKYDPEKKFSSEYDPKFSKKISDLLRSIKRK